MKDFVSTALNATTGFCDSVRIGILGVGRQVMRGHLPALRALGDAVEVLAVCDTVKTRRAEVAQCFPNVRHYRRAEDMFDDPDLDLVLIATPSSEHEALVRGALARELAVVVETPPALTVAGLSALRKQATGSGRFFVSAPMLFEPAFDLARAARQAPQLGDVYEISVRRTDYHRRDDWQSYRKCGGGIAHYALLEALLAARLLLGQTPRKLWSEMRHLISLGDAEDHVRVIFSTPGAPTVNVLVSEARFGADDPLFEIRGTRGVFRVKAGATVGETQCVDPEHIIPHRRAIQSLPPFEGRSEVFPVVTLQHAAEDTRGGFVRMWAALVETMHARANWPVTDEELWMALGWVELIRQTAQMA